MVSEVYFAGDSAIAEKGGGMTDIYLVQSNMTGDITENVLQLNMICQPVKRSDNMCVFKRGGLGFKTIVAY